MSIQIITGSFDENAGKPILLLTFSSWSLLSLAGFCKNSVI